MKFLIPALVLAGCAAPSPTAQPLNEYDRTRFLISAVFEGLLEDEPDPGLLSPLIEEQDLYFVEKCPVCWPVIDGIRSYLGYREQRHWPMVSASRPPDWAQGFKSPDRMTKMKTIEIMVSGYVERRFRQLGWSPVEKEQMRTLLREATTSSMKHFNPGFGDYCPSCSGASKK